MSATRLHKLTAVSFAVLYGVVGFTGEALHYLLTDPSLFWPGAESAELGVYYHTHGPDYHGHFHRHTHHSHHAHVAQSDEARRATGETAITDDESSHEPHSCPLLVLVSTLKLGQGGGAIDIIPDRFVSAPCHRSALCAFEIPLNSYPRGPPNGFCA